MKILETLIGILTTVGRWIALITMVFMMFFIAIGVISRALGKPLLGDVEVVQLAMIVLIMFGLAYTAAQGAHISIGLIVDKFPNRLQSFLDIVAAMMTVFITFIISWFFFQGALVNMKKSIISTTLLEVPFYPFKFIISIGFLFWGLQAILGVIKATIHLIKGTIEETDHEAGADGL